MYINYQLSTLNAISKLVLFASDGSVSVLISGAVYVLTLSVSQTPDVALGIISEHGKVMKFIMQCQNC
jgi:hypothetical protein